MSNNNRDQTKTEQLKTRITRTEREIVDAKTRLENAVLAGLGVGENANTDDEATARAALRDARDRLEICKGSLDAAERHDREQAEAEKRKREKRLTEFHTLPEQLENRHTAAANIDDALARLAKAIDDCRAVCAETGEIGPHAIDDRVTDYLERVAGVRRPKLKPDRQQALETKSREAGDEVLWRKSRGLFDEGEIYNADCFSKPDHVKQREQQREDERQARLGADRKREDRRRADIEKYGYVPPIKQYEDGVDVTSRAK